MVEYRVGVGGGDLYQLLPIVPGRRGRMGFPRRAMVEAELEIPSWAIKPGVVPDGRTAADAGNSKLPCVRGRESFVGCVAG